MSDFRGVLILILCITLNFDVLFVLLSYSLSHFLFPHDFSGTIADTDTINTPPEPFPPTDMSFGDHKTETKDLGGMFCILRLAVCFVLLFEAHSIEPNVFF